MDVTVPSPALMTPAEVDLRELVTADSLLLALDFDGVLAPLQDDPETSRMVPASAAAIAQLVRLPSTRVALVSGRDIATLRRLTRVSELAQAREAVWMIGSHGAEADLGAGSDLGTGSDLGAETDHSAQTGSAAQTGSGIQPGSGPRPDLRVTGTRSPELTAAEEEMLAAIDAHIDAFTLTLSEAGDVPDVLVEHKPYSRTVHTRGIPAEVAAALHEHATEVVAQFPDIRVIEGHDITELAVKTATKGDGLRALIAEASPAAVLYLGDDVTDEDAFAELENVTTGLAIKVGPATTRAPWRITGPSAVAELLTRIAGERRARSPQL